MSRMDWTDRFPSVTVVLLAISAAVLLSACGSAPKRLASGVGAVVSKGVKRASANDGGYYKDDGPGEETPDNLDEIPDAVPRHEPLHRFANRPYTVLGKNYVPAAKVAHFRQQGVASWYGRRFHNNPTSSGELYDMYGMTAAHPTLPIPSYVRVTNMDNRRSVVVRVNDRGPFHKERVIDLSYTAAYKLGYVNAGSARVEVEQIIPGKNEVLLASDERNERRRQEASVSVLPPAVAPEPVTKQVFLQLGAFASRDNAERFRASVQDGLASVVQRMEIFAEGAHFRLHAGPYASVEAAHDAAERIEDLLRLKPFVVMR